MCVCVCPAEWGPNTCKCSQPAGCRMSHIDLTNSPCFPAILNQGICTWLMQSIKVTTLIRRINGHPTEVLHISSNRLREICSSVCCQSLAIDRTHAHRHRHRHRVLRRCPCTGPSLPFASSSHLATLAARRSTRGLLQLGATWQQIPRRVQHIALHLCFAGPLRRRCTAGWAAALRSSR